MARVTARGKYAPKNPSKYIGNIHTINYRSSWEHEFMKFLDNNPYVLHWASEHPVIPYIKPTDKRIHRYLPDFFMEYVNKHGEILQEIIEIKPKEQTVQPKTVGKNKKTQLYEAVTWAVNKAKWAAAQQFCEKNGLKFRIITECNQFK